jgi:alpha-tubulin suppressor-like RCC1 family protein
VARGRTLTVAAFVSAAIGVAVSFDVAHPSGRVATDRIALGDAHTCAIKDDGTVWCFGDNSDGQLGNSSFGPPDSTTPVQTSGFGTGRTAVQVAAGERHTCALLDNGEVWCWGYNGNLELGSVGGSQPDPVKVPLGAGITASRIFVGGRMSCALTSDNRLTCWGQNHKGQIGNGTVLASGGVAPTAVSNIPTSFAPAHVDPGGRHVCAAATGGAVWCWGDDDRNQLGTAADGAAAVNVPGQADTVTAARSVATGLEYSCAVLTDDTVSCWGRNHLAQLGRGSVTPASTAAPAAVSIGAPVSKVAAGKAFACALTTAGAVWCWGENAAGQVGDATAGSPRLAPAQVSNLGGTAVDVVAGGAHACAVLSSGAVRCWGDNSAGQLGMGGTDYTARDAPATVTALSVTPAPTTVPTVAPTTVAPIVAPTTAPPMTSPTTAPATTPVSPTWTASTTDATTTTTTVAPASGASTGTTGAVTSTAKPSLRVTVRRGRTVSAATIAKAAGLAIPRRSQGTMRISIVSGTVRCVFAGSAVRGTSTGTCRVRVLLVPKRGATVSRTVTLTVVR